MSGLTGKVVLITGASSGIGAGAAIHLASLGCQLSLVGRNQIRLLETAHKCRQSGAELDQILTIVADLSNTEEAEKIIETTIKKFQRLDVLVNVAGIVSLSPIEHATVEEYEYVTKIVATTPYFLTKFAIPHLKKTKGNIINVSSVGAVFPIRNLSISCIAKAALNSLTKSAALELADYGIRVNTISPGPIVTPLMLLGALNEEQKQKRIQTMSATTIQKRCGTVDEVAQLIAFIADNTLSAYITGAEIPINGGLHLTTLTGVEKSYMDSNQGNTNQEKGTTPMLYDYMKIVAKL